MTTSDWDGALRAALSRTLEQLCYAVPEPGAAPSLDGSSPQAVARVGFRGPFSGVMVLRVWGGAVLPALARDMLGCDAEPESAVLADCLAEMANVSCGTLLPLAAGSQQVFDVAAPLVSWGSDAEVSGRLAGRAAVALDNGTLEATVHLQDAGAP
ncbi:MAG: hypothetical protein IT376_01100 [Polyangiaceae bacterium]|nr:hypothetical protein [Polyangiaceae bacterium]